MALQFDGIDDYLTKTHATGGPVSSYPFTLAAWFKPPTEYKDWQGFVLSDGTETARYGIGPANFGRWAIYRLGVEKRSASGFGGGYSKTTANDWSHAAGVFNGQSDRKLYVNGSSNLMSDGGNIGATTLTDANIIGIGYGPTNGTNAIYKGEIAEAAIYNAALTADEIDHLYAGVSPLFIRPDSLISYFPLGGLTASDSGQDLIGSNSLTVNSSPADFQHPHQIYPSSPLPLSYPRAAAPIVPGELHGFNLPDERPQFKTPRQRFEYTHGSKKPHYRIRQDGS